MSTSIMLARLLAAAILLAASAARAAPSRIMSLNLCADQLVLALAPPGTIASVTYLARDCRISVQCKAAAQVPVNHATAEELVVTFPDLVIAGRYSTPATVALARRFGFAVRELDEPTTLEAVRDQINEVASMVGAPRRGTAMIAALDAKLAALPRPRAGRPRPVAVVYETRGFTVGKGSLIDDLLTHVGFDNLATKLGIDNYPSLPLEELVMAQPDLLITEAHKGTSPSLGEALLQNPILTGGFPPARQAVVPQRFWICGGPQVASAMQILVAARDQIGIAQK